MKSRSLRIQSVLPSPVRAKGGSPVIIKGNNKAASSHTKANGSKLKKVLVPGVNPAKTCRLGRPSAIEEEAEDAAGVVNLDATPDRPRIPHSLNDNYCLTNPVVSFKPVNSVICVQRQTVNVVPSLVVAHAPTVTKFKDRGDVGPSLETSQIKSVKCASFVDPCVSSPCATNAPSVANAPPVGGRLQEFWQKWLLLGANPRVTSILKEGYILPFNHRPPLVRDPLIVSGYANPIRNLYLKEALQALLKKKAVERVRVRTSLGFFNRLFIVPKPNQKWWPILDLSALNKFLSVKTFKMETPETIRLSLQQGEWVTSLDFSDAYFHIPVHNQSRKSSDSIFKARPISSGPSPSASPQLLWSSLEWSKK